MPFRVRRTHDLDGLAPGNRVSFELVAGTAVARGLRRVSIDDGLPAGAKPTPVSIGAEVPDFELLDEQGANTRLSNYRGRVAAIDFIYTRCPLPDVCPRLSANFAALQKRVPDLALISITVDPEYDRPDVLARYARRYGADASRWKFLTGSLDEVRRAAAFFGIAFWPEEGMIAHSATTAVIDRHGKLAALVEGTSYRWEQLRDIAEAVMK